MTEIKAASKNLVFCRVVYSRLNARQKENYNFQKISGLLAEYGFTTMRLSDDWKGADFIAQHIDGATALFVQLKSRLTFNKKYLKKDIWICFPHGGSFYLFPHDDILAAVLERTNIGNTESWQKRGGYSFPHASRVLLRLLEPYLL